MNGREKGGRKCRKKREEGGKFLEIEKRSREKEELKGKIF